MLGMEPLGGRSEVREKVCSKEERDWDLKEGSDTFKLCMPLVTVPMVSLTFPPQLVDEGP